MGVDLDTWLKHCQTHPLKFKFDGLNNGRRMTDDFYKTVGEAAVADERFMDDYLSNERDYHKKAFDEAVKARTDTEECLSRFCEFAAHKISAADWPAEVSGNIDWDKAPIEQIMIVVDRFADKLGDDYISDWVVGDPDPYWDMIKEPDYAATLLKDHPPIEVWNHAGGYGVDLDDVLLVCPSCHGEPHTEEDLTECYGLRNGYPHFYCGSCGGEATLGQHENLLDFFNALEVTPYPFNQKKQEHWKALMAARKALGENKLDLKTGEAVHLKVTRERDSSFGSGTWTEYCNEPGELVTIIRVTNTTTTEGEITTHAGVITQERGFVEFGHIFGRPVEVTK